MNSQERHDYREQATKHANAAEAKIKSAKNRATYAATRTDIEVAFAHQAQANLYLAFTRD